MPPTAKPLRECRSVEFVVPAVPIAQPRQRHRVVNGHAQNYLPAKHPVSAFKATVRLAAQQAFHDVLRGPLRMTINAVFPRPERLRWTRRPMPRTLHITKPDFDNVAKSCADALSGTIFNDDKELASVTITKWIAAGDEQPHVRIRIEEMAD